MVWVSALSSVRCSMTVLVGKQEALLAFRNLSPLILYRIYAELRLYGSSRGVWSESVTSMTTHSPEISSQF